ncbi:DNA polymerase [Bacillus phage SP-15]|uniref:DNA polymerase n=1 Tax=Bacillus phage SP-15 TaxID=1792032 RepID=A0A127AW86_9CAUD|nr:DNA polymerase [Bacillus phage SP-15]AMM44908.1 DNA polymerase [Bacillus phage SP-15]
MADTSTSKEIFPIGTLNPTVYIVGESPGAIMGQAGTYLQKITRSLGLDTEINLRMFSISRKFGEVDASYMTQSSRFVLADLAKTKPKVIIGLGATPAGLLTGSMGRVSDIRGNVEKITVGDHECYFITTFHPGYILNNAGNTAIMKTFLGDFRKAIAASEGKVDANSDKDLRIALTAQEFETFLKNEYTADGETSYDIETNGADELSNKAKVVGFSIAPDEVKGIYVIFEALEYKMPEEDVERCKTLLRDFLKERRVIIHNQMYERPYTLNENWLGYDLHDNIDDTLVMSRLMLGGKTGAGLKDQCRLNLGYTKWSEDLDKYLHRFNELQNNLAPTNAGSLREEHKVLIQEKSVKALADYMILQVEESLNRPTKEGHAKTKDIPGTLELIRSTLSNDNIAWSDMKEVMENFKVFDNRQRNVAIAAWKMVKLIERFYTTEEEFNLIDGLVAKAINDRLEKDDYSFVSYGLVPMKIIAPYGALDAVATVDLKKYYYKRMKEESETLGLDLLQGYSNWMKHFKMAYVMERNGAFWNEELVKKERKFLEGTAVEATRTLHKSPLMADFLAEKKSGSFATFVVTKMPDAISRSREIFISDIRTKKRSKKKKEVVFSDGSVIEMTSTAILDLLTPEELENAKQAWIKDMNDTIFSEFTKISEFKEYFNPGSPANKTYLNKILVNDEVRAARFLSKVKNELFTQDNFSVDNYPASDRMFLKAVQSILDRMSGIKKAVADLEEDEIIDNPEWADLDEEEEVTVDKITAKEGFAEYIEVLRTARLESPDLVNMFAECLNWDLPGTKEMDMIRLHETYQLMGIDIEDESLWNEEYRFLYNFRLYKKCMKLVSSYITGKLGYENAWIVDGEKLASGEKFVPREVKYKAQGLKTNPGQVVLLQTSFAPCSAETGRWRAGIHTIPFGSSIKELYTSRFPGGTIAAPDFSQMEIRAMAGAANDKKLLDAFLRGEDIHKFNAQQIFKREDVTEVERRFSKMASFAILYGSSEYSVAQSYFKGAASDIAGVVLYKVQEFIEENNFISKPFCFIHDSIEIDLHPMEMIQISKQIIPLMNNFPYEEFGVPCKAGLTIGPSMGEEIEVEEIVSNDDFSEATFHLVGYINEIEHLADVWKVAYPKVVMEDVYDDAGNPKIEDQYISRHELFFPKRAFSRYTGTTRKFGHKKIHITIK